MSEFKTSANEQSAVLLDDAVLENVVGGSADSDFQSFLDAHSVGGWTMRDVFAKPVLGRYTPR
ncbi:MULTISPECIES: hypothetical protein [unclassified Bradyrhizobium]|uniref:hypothetical protein n=1 Tax=unclassified Bradyrhizobium TaxID=2631580 RepID=UPI0020B37BA5|nr:MULTISPECIES: hypothetical protein [unclassified Bradyrhizobium]MCP3381294.1 hypothetical protein [Bradyrhizobium sp. CCGUVB4N]MCP3442382.1 hypothetical protein [Bradyrhizobium sp. CCGUVB14]WFU79074.1 hypothetical protein QA645_31770 [Bradyrhizobium sp. CIAT3101]